MNTTPTRTSAGMAVASVASLTVTALATARLTRLITSDWLGEWHIVRPLKRWAVNEQDGVMGRRCMLVVNDAGRAELERLNRSGLRAEAERARAVL